MTFQTGTIASLKSTKTDYYATRDEIGKLASKAGLDSVQLGHPVLVIEDCSGQDFAFIMLITSTFLYKPYNPLIPIRKKSWNVADEDQTFGMIASQPSAQDFGMLYHSCKQELPKKSYLQIAQIYHVPYAILEEYEENAYKIDKSLVDSMFLKMSEYLLRTQIELPVKMTSALKRLERVDGTTMTAELMTKSLRGRICGLYDPHISHNFCNEHTLPRYRTVFGLITEVDEEGLATIHTVTTGRHLPKPELLGESHRVLQVINLADKTPLQHYVYITNKPYKYKVELCFTLQSWTWLSKLFIQINSNCRLDSWSGRTNRFAYTANFETPLTSSVVMTPKPTLSTSAEGPQHTSESSKIYQDTLPASNNKEDPSRIPTHMNCTNSSEQRKASRSQIKTLFNIDPIDDQERPRPESANVLSLRESLLQSALEKASTLRTELAKLEQACSCMDYEDAECGNLLGLLGNLAVIASRGRRLGEIAMDTNV